MHARVVRVIVEGKGEEVADRGRMCGKKTYVLLHRGLEAFSINLFNKGVAREEGRRRQ